MVGLVLRSDFIFQLAVMFVEGVLGRQFMMYLVPIIWEEGLAVLIHPLIPSTAYAVFDPFDSSV